MLIVEEREEDRLASVVIKRSLKDGRDTRGGPRGIKRINRNQFAVIRDYIIDHVVILRARVFVNFKEWFLVDNGLVGLIEKMFSQLPGENHKIIERKGTGSR